MQQIDFSTLISVAIPVISGAFAIVQMVDRRLDKIEADSKLIIYRLEQLETDSDRRARRLELSLGHVTAFLEKNSGFYPRSRSSDGRVWPSDDPPSSFLEPPSEG